MSPLESSIRRVLNLLLPKIHSLHKSSPQPIILGITGLQGSGKSTWASLIVKLLTSEHGLNTITISLDDLYKSHDDLIAWREKDSRNKLYRTRGQPGTHDEQLAAQFFAELRGCKGNDALKIPRFDKSKFNGEGDRVPEEEWPRITTKPDVVVFEGWCVGFQPLSLADVEKKQQLASAGKLPVNTPAKHKLEHLLEVNESLKKYCDTFMGPQHFDFMIHIDTDDLLNVYRWRLEQEHKLIAAKGTGMKDEEVRAFVDGYMPGYELYLDRLRVGFFDEKGKQVRVVLDGERGVDRVEEL
ncbi:P-loop containing nucleoside triphosphate hydrolase protein [Lentithecium fluviatile CBS 122367]|uniref:P-loop containing nucleoside triphosphate hydrolase protein n=1 Tax=Lentithecium fluviatile CBS 122367 TaxID=1168545 RepID=A0A6G1JL67_9PLEO|nr:P-loop containing nucleoside triphosphate hydrolase protein [Lentithecium fluviatile CBS 122367]